MKSTKAQKSQPTIRFDAKISMGKLAVPKNINSKLQIGIKSKVEGILNGLPFQSALGSDSKGMSFIPLSEAMQSAAARDGGDVVMVEITRLGDEVETRVPKDFEKAIISVPKAKALWDDITPIARRDWIFWVISGKKEETRKRRIKVACDKMKSGMRRVCCFGGIVWLMKTNGTGSVRSLKK